MATSNASGDSGGDSKRHSSTRANSDDSTAGSSTLTTTGAQTVRVLLLTIGADSALTGIEQTGLANALGATGFSVSPVSVRDDSEIANIVSPPEHNINESETDQHSDKATDISTVKLAVVHQPGTVVSAGGESEDATGAHRNVRKPDANQPGKSHAETHPQKITSQLVAALQHHDIPVIAATTSDQQLPYQRRQTTPTADKKNLKVQTLPIRDSYREHDHALLIRQIFSLLGIEPTDPISAYPIPPVKLSGAVALSQPDIDQQINEQIPDWTLTVAEPPSEQPATALTREMKFGSFQAAIQFMHCVAPACDVANHHPRWENNWRTLRIDLTTWDANQRVTERDTQLARYFDHIYRTFGFAT